MADSVKSLVLPPPDARDRLVAQIEGVDLADWERLFCLWLAQHPNRRKITQLEIATVLKGDPVTWSELLQVRQSPAFLTLLARERSFLGEIERAREGFLGNYPKAARVWGKSLTALEEELDTPGADKLNAVRAATPLLTGVLDRLHPKKDDQAPAVTAVQINLTVQQAREMDAPEYVVNAEEVVVEALEIIPNDDIE